MTPKRNLQVQIIFQLNPSSFPYFKQLTPLREKTIMPSCAKHVTTLNAHNQTESDGGTIYVLFRNHRDDPWTFLSSGTELDFSENHMDHLWTSFINQL